MATCTFCALGALKLKVTRLSASIRGNGTPAKLYGEACAAAAETCAPPSDKALAASASLRRAVFMRQKFLATTRGRERARRRNAPGSLQRRATQKLTVVVNVNFRGSGFTKLYGNCTRGLPAF